jgi:hypothetical protein
LAIDKEKIEAINNLDYPRTLSDLETGLGLFGYYRKFYLGFLYIVEPLEQLKTALLKGAPYKNLKRRGFINRTLAEFYNDKDNDKHNDKDYREA